MPTCLVVQHVAAEPAWSIADAVARAGILLDVRRVFAGDPVPTDVTGYGGVVVMGGPMSAASDDQFPSRRAEVGVLADALEGRIPTLGICLGAQLLARAAGAAVYPGPFGPEIGWGPVSLSVERRGDPLFDGLPTQLTVLHWHGDTFDLPSGAVRLASNARYANQAFRLGPVAWGLQFHMEVTGDAVQGLLEAFSDEAGPSAGSIRRDTPRHLAGLAAWSGLVFDRFASLVAGGASVGSPLGFADISDA